MTLSTLQLQGYISVQPRVCTDRRPASKIEIKLQFPYVVQAQCSMSIAQQLIPIYTTPVHKNKSTVALNVAYVHAIS